MRIEDVFTPSRLLKAMLTALALAAAAGAAAAVLQIADIWRVVATAVIGAVVALVMIGAAVLMRKPRLRAAGAFGLVWSIAMYVMASAAVWGDVLPSPVRDLVLWTFAGVFFCGVPTLFGLMRWTYPEDRLALIVLGCVTALAFLGYIGLGVQEMAGGPVYRYGTVVFAYLGLGLLAAIGLSGETRGPLRLLRWIGPIAAAVGWVIVANDVFTGERSTAWIQTFLFLTAAVTALASFLNHFPLPRGAAWLRWTTLTVAVGTAAVFVAAAEVNASGDDRFGLLRLGAGGAIISGAGTLAVCVLSLLGRRAGKSATRAGSFALANIECPRCQRALVVDLPRSGLAATTASGDAVGAGGCACPGCRLVIAVSVGVPVCPACDYDLSSFAGTSCPECGATLHARALARERASEGTHSPAANPA